MKFCSNFKSSQSYGKKVKHLALWFLITITMSCFHLPLWFLINQTPPQFQPPGNSTSHAPTVSPGPTTSRRRSQCPVGGARSVPPTPGLLSSGSHTCPAGLPSSPDHTGTHRQSNPPPHDDSIPRRPPRIQGPRPRTPPPASHRSPAHKYLSAPAAAAATPARQTCPNRARPGRESRRGPASRPPAPS